MRRTPPVRAGATSADRGPSSASTASTNVQRDERTAGFTLLEILGVLLIVCILSLLIIPNYSRLVAAAQEVICASHMRSIRVALGSYLQDHGNIWPQPQPGTESAELRRFWFDALEPYGISESTWQCPTIRHALREEGQTGDFGMHYVPTQFDATPGIATRWSTQPWLIEAANAHGKGSLICFPDGSVKSMSKVLAEQGVR